MLKKHLPLITFLTLYFCITAYKLVSHPTPFFDWDESINAQVAKEMIENKSLTPLWQGNTWLDKPPLPFLFFGIIMKLTPFVQPELSLRITSLLLSLISLIFIYALFYRATKDKLAPLLTVIITSFTPIFLQRSQILNLDVFLLIGWLGYLLFVQNFWLSFIFLAISVLTKSLIGFYPVAIYLSYNLFLLLSKKLTLKDFKKIALKQFSSTAILVIWYISMFLQFGKDFWQQHIIETHFMRVTASIESHFGQRTFYLDLIREQLGIFFWLSLIGIFLVISNAVRNLAQRKNYEWILFSLFLLPWFIFLNLTKTKIFWYLYPAIPQFAFLSVYPLTLLKNKKVISYLLTLILISYLLQQNFIKTNFFTTFYSKPEDHYKLALYAKDKCDSLNVLVGKETREANKTLEDLGLTITSTTQWGDHPSIVYYFGKKVNFIYNENQIKLVQNSKKINTCLALKENDLDLLEDNKINLSKKFGLLLFIK